jgi:hypothetical protein
VKVVVATTIPPYKSTDPDSRESLAWLATLDGLADHAWAAGIDVHVFAALELDSRGVHVHARTFDVLRRSGLPFDWWEFTVRDGAEHVTTANRLHRICAGRNLITEYALRERFDAILYLDSDLKPDPESIPKLVGVDWPIVGGRVEKYYGPDGNGPWGPPGEVPVHPRTGGEWPFRVEEHWTTAGYLLVLREVFRKVRWGHDAYDDGPTDDQWYQESVKRLALPSMTDADGVVRGTLVRQDCLGVHKPLIPLEDRGQDRRLAGGGDMRVSRAASGSFR